MPSYCVECKKDGKKKRAGYAFEGQPPTHCKPCAKEGMVSVHSKKCMCGRAWPCYNYKGQPPKYCMECKKEGMVNVHSKKCMCGRAQPCYNHEGQPPKYCMECKEEGMINVVSKKCMCGRAQPSFNYEGQPPKYCMECKEGGMVDVASKKCMCGKAHPSFNYEGQPPKYCMECKEEGMVDVKSKKCVCGRAQPCYNYEGQPPKYCTKCKEEGMVDVRSKRCMCGRAHPHFNYEGLPPRYCAKCKEDGMVDVCSKNCIVCNERKPSYSYEGDATLTHCGGCKEPNMIYMFGKYYCRSCHLFIVSTPGDECWTCRTASNRHKRKEKEIEKAFSTHPELHLHTLRDNAHPCAKSMGIRAIRPDWWWEFSDWVLCLEVDEHAHRIYEASCEQKRIHELHEIAQKPLLLFRYNPDAKSLLNNLFTPLGKRSRDDDDEKDEAAAAAEKYAWLCKTLLAIIRSNGKLVSLPTNNKLEVRGSDVLRVIYAGYPAKRVDELWMYLEKKYEMPT